VHGTGSGSVSVAASVLPQMGHLAPPESWVLVRKNPHVIVVSLSVSSFVPIVRNPCVDFLVSHFTFHIW
jgi:hypothetical protein